MSDVHGYDGAPLAVGDKVTVLSANPSYNNGNQ